MTTLFKWLLTFPIAVLVVFFSVMNMALAPLSWSPFHADIELPVFAIILGAFGIGFLWGGFIVWLNASPVRKKIKEQRKQIKKLEKEIELGTIKPDSTNLITLDEE